MADAMLIHSVEPFTGNLPQRNSGANVRAETEAALLLEGLIRGRVDALLADGQVRVSAAGRVFQFTPPRPLVLGEIVDLKVVAREPQLILELADSTQDAAPELSRAATLIARLAAPGAPRPGVINLPGPLLAAPPLESAQTPVRIAAQLSAAVSGSGLFYESHQAEWVEGLRPLAQLRAEPQARLPLQQQRIAAAGIAALPVAPALPEPADSVAIAALARQVTESQAAERLQQAHPETLALVRTQLDALDSRRLYWAGELWPGQPAEWEISDEEPRKNPSLPESVTPRLWQTQLRFTLPRLGTITATIEAQGATAGIRIQAAAADSTATLTAETAALRTALAASGVTVRELVIAQTPAEPPAAAPLHAIAPGSHFP